MLLFSINTWILISMGNCSLIYLSFFNALVNMCGNSFNANINTTKFYTLMKPEKC